jgi:hypothetical protein
MEDGMRSLEATAFMSCTVWLCLCWDGRAFSEEEQDPLKGLNLNAPDDALKQRFEELKARLLKLAGDQEKTVIAILQLPATEMKANHARITNARGRDWIVLGWMLGTPDRAGVDIHVYGSFQEAVESLAGTAAQSSAPKEVVDRQIGTTFGECTAMGKRQSLLPGSSVSSTRRLPRASA